MAESLRVWLKKTFSLSLILNSMITLASVAGIMYGFYHAWPWWKPYWPYLVNGNLFLVAGVAAIINIFPSASIGRALHTGRLFFHHYVYGSFVLIFSSILIIASTSIDLFLSLFFVNTASVGINAGRFFVLTGATLILDDLPDVSKRIERGLNKVKSGFCRIRKPMYVAQLITGLITFYVFLGVLISSIQRSALTVSNGITICALFITSVTALALVKRKAWLKITPPEACNHESH